MRTVTSVVMSNLFTYFEDERKNNDKQTISPQLLNFSPSIETEIPSGEEKYFRTVFNWVVS
jgi:hypothetical protein